MRRRLKLTIWAAAVILLFTTAISCADEYNSKQTILTWTKDPCHSQTVSWEKDNDGVGYVQYNEAGKGLSPSKQVKATEVMIKAGEYYRYTAEITGLKRNTAYQYRVGNGRQWSTTRTFTTAPSAKEWGQEFSFLYLGDVQHQNSLEDYNIWGKLLQNAYNRNPSAAFGILGGDMVNSPDSLKQWNLFLNNAGSVFSQIPLMTVPGNHETVAEPKTYLKVMELAENGPEGLEEEFYSFNYGDCHFVMMNSGFLMKERRESMGEVEWNAALKRIDSWLKEDLADNGASWNIAVMHHPMYGMNDGDDIDDIMRNEWESAFQNGKVDLVLCGHQHVYMRTQEIGGITYVMGNSGQRRSTYYDGENFPDYGVFLDATNSSYQVVKVTAEKLMLTSYDEKGQIIDRWTKKTDHLTRGKMIGIGIVLLIVVMIFIVVRIFLLRKGTGARRPY